MNTMYNSYKMIANAPYVANIFNSFYINGYGSLCMAKIAHSDLSGTCRFLEAKFENSIDSNRNYSDTEKTAMKAISKQVIQYIEVSCGNYLAERGLLYEKE